MLAAAEVGPLGRQTVPAAVVLVYQTESLVPMVPAKDWPSVVGDWAS